jgi:hypothetical protein
VPRCREASPAEDGPPGVFSAIQSFVARWTSPLRAFSVLAAPAPAPSQPKISIIGIHGWYPTKLLQRVVGVGQPSLTSNKLVSRMAAVLATHYHGPWETPAVDKENDEGSVPGLARPLPSGLDPSRTLSLALEGEGKIMDRVQAYYDTIRDRFDPKNAPSSYPFSLTDSEELYMISHSQGAPVSILLLYQLIVSGLLPCPAASSQTESAPADPPSSSSWLFGANKASTMPSRRTAKMTLLCLAGILHGPFPELGQSYIVQYLEAESSRELFELNEVEQLEEEVQEVIKEFGQTSGNVRAENGGGLYPSELKTLRAKVRFALLRLLDWGVRVVGVGSWMDQVVPVSIPRPCMYVRHYLSCS